MDTLTGCYRLGVVCLFFEIMIHLRLFKFFCNKESTDKIVGISMELNRFFLATNLYEIGARFFHLFFLSLFGFFFT